MLSPADTMLLHNPEENCGTASAILPIAPSDSAIGSEAAESNALQLVPALPSRLQIWSKYQSSVDENTMMLEGLGAGAESVHFDDGDLIEVITKPNKLQDTVDIFELEDIQLLKHMLIWTPRNLIPINDDETITMILGLMDAVTSMEGIVNVTADFWIPDDKMEKFV